MRSSIRRTTVVLLVTAFLVPGILQARTPQAHWNQGSVSSTQGFFRTVWSLLTSFWLSEGTGSLAKNGCGLDPAGNPLPCEEPSSTTNGTGYTGSGLDPAGHP